jgi:hypothetical protein
MGGLSRIREEIEKHTGRKNLFKYGFLRDLVAGKRAVLLDMGLFVHMCKTYGLPQGLACIHRFLKDILPDPKAESNVALEVTVSFLSPSPAVLKEYNCSCPQLDSL